MKYRGFTLIEILIGIALLAILLALVVAAINPAQRFQDARNTQRFSDITGIMDSINLNMLANNGGYNICGCLVTPGYIASMPFDPNASGASYTSCTTYATKYNVVQSATTNVITVNAPNAEGGETISLSR